MKSKRWTFLFFLCFVLFLIFFMFANYSIDSYGVFRDDFSKQKTEPNLNFVKMKYLLANPNKYDSFIFGASRVGNIDGNKISKKWYNMIYSEAVPAEILENIRLVTRNGVTIKNLLIGLDEFSYLINPEDHLRQYLRKPHPGNTIELWFVFYTFYLLRPPSSLDIAKRFHSEEETNIVFDIYDSGRTLWEFYDKEIELNPAAHINQNRFTEPTRVGQQYAPYHRGGNIERTLQDIRRTVEIAREKNINIIFFMNPIHITTYLDTNMTKFIQFKTGLSRITDFYDFSGINSISTNNYYFYDTSHYRTLVGDMILNRIYGIEVRHKAPKDFGKYITKDNIDEHLISLQQQIKNYINRGRANLG